MSLLQGSSRCVQWIEIDELRAGQRIDNFLLSHLKGVPKSLIYRIVRQGQVRVNKGRIRPHYKLAVGDRIRIPPVYQNQSQPVAVPNDGLKSVLEASILFEDADLLVVNKPSGLAVHGGSGISLGLIESLRQMRPREVDLELVHRLDRDTSGCIMIAKNRQSLKSLQQQLRQGSIEKTYWALVVGVWPNRRQCIKASLLKSVMDHGERRVSAVDISVEGAKASQTNYRVLRRFAKLNESLPETTLVEAKPITGRTHQIRVHSQFCGHSIAGDEKYGCKTTNLAFRQWGLKRLFLHACSLHLKKRNGEALLIAAPLSSELQDCLDRQQPLSPNKRST